MELSKLVELFLKSRKYGYRDEGAKGCATSQTLHNYQSRLSFFLFFLEKRGTILYDAINKNDIREYVDTVMVAPTWSKATKGHYLRVLRTFLNWIEKSEDFEGFKKFSKYLPSVPKYPESKYRSKIPDNDALQKANSYFKEGIYLKRNRASTTKGRFSRTGLRDYVMFLMMVDSGMRVGELTNLKVEAFISYDKRIVCSGKTGPRLVLLKDSTLLWVNRYIKEREHFVEKDCPYLFVTKLGTKVSPGCVSVAFNRVKHRLGITGKLTPHSLRHNFGTQFTKKGGNVAYLQKLLGHSRIETTMQYVEVIDNTLVSLHEQLSPVNDLN
jgi:site-specific recombinase XerD